MNNTFNIARFGSLFRKHTAEHIKYYLMAVGVLAGILLAFVAFHELNASRPLSIQEQYEIFVFSFFFTSAIFTCGIFSDLGNPKSATATLTLPASHLEKFMVKWLYTGVIFPLVFTGIYYTVLIPLQHISSRTSDQAAVINLFAQDDIAYVVVFFAMVHAVCMLGAIYFKKLHFIKTAFAMMVVITLVAILNKWVVQSFLGIKVENAFPFSYTGFMENNQYYLINSSGNTYILYGAVLITSCILWLASYFRLKEKQV